MKNQAKEGEKEGIGQPTKLTRVAVQGKGTSDRLICGGPTAVSDRRRAWEGEEERLSGKGERRGEEEKEKMKIFGFLHFNLTIYILLPNYQNTPP